MYMRKQYGQSKVDECPFCGKQAITTSKEGIPVCLKHKNAVLNLMKCLCGEYLDLKIGKFGFFFICSNCGTMNSNKVFSFNKIEDVSEDVKDQEKQIEKFSQEKFNKGVQSKDYAVQKKTGRITKDPKKFKKKEITIRSDDPLYFS
ncbi:hypothetical protein HN587_03135 [Candidatus Woesearchaeota archaeon]|jgi:hypothetical protein|nr:hypothetical protein [Candidatus Woesearchaeota archaeon]